MYYDKYKALKQMAMESYKNTHAGLYTCLRSEIQISKCIEKSYRLNHFNSGNGLHMTKNEQMFHLMGFIDAIVKLGRMGLIKDEETLISENEECDYEPDEEDLAFMEEYAKTHPYGDYELIMNCIASFETGENW